MRVQNGVEPALRACPNKNYSLSISLIDAGAHRLRVISRKL